MADWDTGVEATASPVSLMELLKQVPDPRSLHGLRHPLSALLGLTVVAVLAGMRGPEAIAQFRRDHGWPLLQHLGFRRKKGPCKATFSNLYRALDVEAFETLFKRLDFRPLPGTERASGPRWQNAEGLSRRRGPRRASLIALCDRGSGRIGPVGRRWQD